MLSFKIFRSWSVLYFLRIGTPS